MTSTTYNPSIDQGAQLMFNDNFFELAQQEMSELESSGVVIHETAEGKTVNMVRIGRIELTEVNVRNPDKQYGDYNIDNRQMTKRRFTKTVTIDAKYDVNELIKDPTSDIVKQLVNAKNRVIDRVIVTAAEGSVLVGAPDAAPSTITAATDGVITVDATSTGITYEKVQEITQNYINNELTYNEFKGAVLAITGTENTDLMGEIEFINNQYMASQAAVADGIVKKAGTYQTVLFGGSVNGGITVANPILSEVSTVRTCLALAPKSVALSMKVALLEVAKSATKVNSWDITIDLWINGMRTEGVRVQKVTTTI